MLSSAASLSSQLLTHLPPGTAPELNITVVAYVSDNLGATAVTSLGVDGTPLVLASILPDQVCHQTWHQTRRLENPFIGSGNCNFRQVSLRVGSKSREPLSIRVVETRLV